MNRAFGRPGTRLVAPEPPKAPAPAEAKAKKAAKRSSDAEGSGGSFLRGCLFCGIGVLIGAGIWYAVAMLAGYELGWIAWGMGILAGLGMRLGCGNDDDLCGITAAFMAVLGIFVAKWLIFAHVLLPIVEALLQELPTD